ncbi:MAG: M28 family peptidase [Phycisphaerales bacterium JB065]
MSTFRPPACRSASHWTRVAALALVTSGVATTMASENGAIPNLSIESDFVIRDTLAELHPDVFLYMQHQITLSNPFMEGRAADTRGSEIAAEYIEWYFKRMGFEPAFTSKTVDFDSTEFEEDGESYQQPFSLRGTREATRALAVFAKGGQRFEPEAGEQFNALGFSANASGKGELVFVGYGIEEGPDGYTSFDDDADLSGKIAMVMRFEPMTDLGRSQWEDGRGWSRHASLYNKIDAIAKRGAAGIVLVNPPGADDPRIDQLGSVTSMNFPIDIDIPAVMVTPGEADRIVRAFDQDSRPLLGLRRIADEGSHSPIALGGTVELDVLIEERREWMSNVGGLLRGAGSLADDYVIVGAHYDHVGYGNFGSRAGTAGRGVLHAGADDNASGTSALLVAAQHLADRYAEIAESDKQNATETPRRSIIFVTFGAEEMGLLGAAHMAEHLGLEKEQVSGMVNLDMVGRLRDSELEAYGMGTSESWEQIVNQANEGLDLNINMIAAAGGRSDHAAFARRDIPAIHFFTGLHNEYHAPGDTADKINMVGAVRVAHLCVRIIENLALREDNLAWDEQPREMGSGSLNPRPRRGRQTEPQANDGPAETEEAPARPETQNRVRFGIAPGSYDSDRPGVLVGEVFENTPASEAGVQPGDLIVTWAGEDVADVRAWFTKFMTHKPGDTVTFQVKRGDETLTLKAELKARGDTD